MQNLVNSQQLIQLGASMTKAEILANQINAILSTTSNEQAWQKISTEILTPQIPFSIHLFLFEKCYPEWHVHPETAPAYFPSKDFVNEANITKFMLKVSCYNVRDFHAWSVTHYREFWQKIINNLGIVFSKKPREIVNLTQGLESPQWLPEAKMNIADSCFNAPPSTNALIYQDSHQQIQTMSYAELNHLSNRVANGLITLGCAAGDAIAIAMPMTVEAVAIYLGIIKMGGVVVSIADSFSSEEIATRLRITKAKAIFTQDYILRNSKTLPLYEKVSAAFAPLTIVLKSGSNKDTILRQSDCLWEDFLSSNNKFTSHPCEPMSFCNILFSSGTTADPKAIPWNHTTAIKAASDAYFHQNIQANDVLAWPTNLGWMMGPWLIFAALINQAAIAIYHYAPNEKKFGEFIQDAKVTMLGVVPTLVASWRESQCMQGLDWSAIQAFSSTGECSNAEDMLYLMSLANYKPIIEYCGGTEIGGSYISSTMIEKNYPAVFTTPAMGSDFLLLDENQKPADNGAVALIPPSIGLSTELLNADHHQIYYANMPKTKDGKILRRHGDQARRLGKNYYCILGRVDDTMNLGGIKISSAEIERVLANITHIREIAAIAISPTHNGPSHLVIFAETKNDNLNKEELLKFMQTRINQHLNPLFKIYDIVFINELPKTASNKIMRRVLREIYQKTANIK